MARKVKIVVTKVPKHFLVWNWEGAVALKRVDLVGLKVGVAMRRVAALGPWRIVHSHCTLNGKELTWMGNDYDIVLKPGDTVGFEDP